MTILAALRAAGLPSFPCRLSRRPDGTWDKSPAVPRGVSWKAVAVDPDQFPTLAWSSGTAGVPIPPGVLVIDLDTYKGGDRSAVERWLGGPVDWGRAFIQRTPSGGEHYAFACDWPARQMQADDDAPPGFDTRAAGRGFICAGDGYTPVGAGVFSMAFPATLPRLPDSARAVLGVPERVERQPSAATTTDEAHVIEALGHLDPGCSRAEWVVVGCALRDLYRDDPDRGRDLFDAWSSGEFWAAGAPPNYIAEHIDHQWYSFKPDGPTHAATLFYRAIQKGWRPPSTFNTAEAFGGGGVAADRFAALVERIRSQGGDTVTAAALADEIRSCGANGLQVALLAEELKGALADVGIKGRQVVKLLDAHIFGEMPAAPRRLEGAVPPPGAYIDSDTPIHPDAWAPMQTKGKDKKPKGTQRNFEIMLQAYGVRIQFDEVGKRLRVTGPHVPGAGTLHDEAVLSYLESLANLNDYPTTSVRAQVATIANRHVYNPVEDWARAHQWDGRDHVGEVWRAVTLANGEDAAFCETLFRKWLRGAYAIGSGRLPRWEHVLTFVDPSGGAGKTRFFASLSPAHLRKDSVILDPADKDSVKMAISYWLVELGDVEATFRRADSCRLKAFLSAEVDEMRLPYGRAYLPFPRRTAFMATVNTIEHLTDDSDNRRFWGMQVVGVNFCHGVDIAQLWAQVVAEVDRGEACFLTPQEQQILKARNERFRDGSPVRDRLAYLQFEPSQSSADVMSLTDILARAGIGKPTKAELNEAARFLRKLGIPEGRRGPLRGFSVRVAAIGDQAFSPKIVS